MPPAVPAGAVIASDALKYVGQGYTYGGRADHPGDWDCSSFVSYVLGHDLGMTLPGGGKYGAPGNPPNVHGPVVMSYATWPGATTLPKGAAPSAGDLCVFAGLGPLGHIGIAVSATQMVSALNPTDGVKQTPIAGNGPVGAPLSYRRVNGSAAGPGGTPAPAAGGQGAGEFAVAVGVPLALAGGALLLGAGLGLLAVAGLGVVVAWVVSRA